MLDTRKSGLIQSSPPSMSRTEMYVSAAGTETKPAVRSRDHSYRDPDGLAALVLRENHEFGTAVAPNVAGPPKADQSFQTPFVEEVVNGSFAADTDWTKGTGWTIAAGLASSDATQIGDSDLTQLGATLVGTLVAGQAYVLVFTVSGQTLGNVTGVVGDAEGTDRTEDGTYTETIVAGAGADLDIRADLAFDGDVTGVSLSRVTAGTVAVGERLTLMCGAVSTIAVTYQWQLDASDVVGETAETLVIDAAAAADAGVYTCDVTNTTGTTSSPPITVTVV